MSKLTKVVNIYPTGAITGVNPPIRSVVRRVTKSTDEIRACLMARAIVEEIASDGSVIRLNLNNYNVDNAVSVKEPVIEEPVVEEEVVEESDTTKEIWDAAYNEALAGKDLDSMSKKQRRAAISSAKAAADAAVSEFNSVSEEAPVEEPVVEETVEAVVEEEVVTADAEDLSTVIE